MRDVRLLAACSLESENDGLSGANYLSLVALPYLYQVCLPIQVWTDMTSRLDARVRFCNVRVVIELSA